jgi:1,2-diacylglycerol 3-alpha-glucosyltransferase
MKIGFFTDTYSPQVNGVVTSILNLSKEFTRRKNKLCVFAPYIKGAKDASHTYYYNSVIYPLYPEYRMAILAYKKAYKDAMKEKLEVIHAHSSMFLGVAAKVASNRLKVPLVGTFHTLIPDFVSLFYGRVFGFFTRPILWKSIKEFYRRCDTVTVPSEYTKEVMGKKGIDSVVIPNGINFNEFGTPKKNIRKQWGIGEDEFLILHVGRISYEKRIKDILKSALTVTSDSKKVKYMILSDGPQRKKLEQFVAKKGLQNHVTFTGYVPQEDLASYYSSSDLFVTASPFETQGLSVIEAMYFGKPVIAVNAGALRDVVNHGETGILYNGRIDKLTEMIQFLIEDPRTRARLGRNAKNDVQKFDIKTCVDKFLKLYESLM